MCGFKWQSSSYWSYIRVRYEVRHRCHHRVCLGVAARGHGRYLVIVYIISKFAESFSFRGKRKELIVTAHSASWRFAITYRSSRVCFCSICTTYLGTEKSHGRMVYYGQRKRCHKFLHWGITSSERVHEFTILIGQKRKDSWRNTSGDVYTTSRKHTKCSARTLWPLNISI